MNDQLALEPAKTLSTAQIATRLRAKYCAPEYGILFEVRNATGWSTTTRSADALVMSLWPSRGLTMHGIEIKASRSDWLRELKNPAKAEEIAAYCDHWWVAVGDKDIVKDGELPAAWGLLIPRGTELVVYKQPSILKPNPVDRAFLAAMFRRAAESSASAEEIGAAVAAKEQALRAQVAKNRDYQLLNAQEDLKNLREKQAAFREASGIDIERGWKGAKAIGEAVKFVMDGGIASAEGRLHALGNEAEHLCDSIKKSLATIEALK